MTASVRGWAQASDELSVVVPQTAYSTAPVAGDLLVAFIAADGDSLTFATPSGWSSISSRTDSTNGIFTGYAVYTKTAAGTSADGATFSNSAGANGDIVATVACVENPGTFSAGTVVEGAEVSSLTTASLGAAGSLLLCHFVDISSSSGSVAYSSVPSTPSGMTSVGSEANLEPGDYADISFRLAAQALGTPGTRTASGMTGFFTQYGAAVAIAASGSHSVSVSDTASPTDSIARMQSRARVGSETASPTDSLTRTHTGSRTGSETASPTDTLGRAQTDNRTASDTATPTDSIGRSPWSLARNPSDIASPADTVTRGAWALTRAAQDIASATDSIARGAWSLVRGAAEAASPVDVIARVVALARAVIDIASPTDTVTISRPVEHRNIAVTIGAPSGSRFTVGTLSGTRFTIGAPSGTRFTVGHLEK